VDDGLRIPAGGTSEQANEGVAGVTLERKLPVESTVNENRFGINRHRRIPKRGRRRSESARVAIGDDLVGVYSPQ
jgi:hypothetical protein